MELIHSDSHFDYLGYGVHKSYCDLEIWKSGDKYFIILTEPNADSGTSVTNAIENIATQIYSLGLFDNVHPDNIVWIEHYTYDGKFEETYDQVKLEFQRKNDVVTFAHPTWVHIGEKLSETTIVKLMDGE